jgi:hypothetical protein
MPAAALILPVLPGRVRLIALKQFFDAEVLSKNKKMREAHPPSHHHCFFPIFAHRITVIV